MYGDGSLGFDKSRKKWIVQWYDLAGKQHKKRFANKDDAKVFRTSVAAKKTLGTATVNSSMPLGEWMVKYLSTYAQPSVQPSTFAGYRSCAKRIAPIAHIPLNRLRAVDIDILYADLAKKFAPGTVKITHIFLSFALSKAFTLQLINRNPLVAVTPPRTQRRKLEVFTDSELRRIFSSLLPRSFRLYLRVLLFSGMRPGEACALRYASLDLMAGVIHVTQTLKRFNGTYGTPKTAAGVRDIPVPRFLLKELLADGGDSDELVFQEKFRAIDYSWQKLKKQLSLSQPLYAFRHTYATRMLASGIPVLEVSRCMGHASPSITLNVYGHVIPGFNKKIASVTEEVFSAVR